MIHPFICDTKIAVLFTTLYPFAWLLTTLYSFAWRDQQWATEKSLVGGHRKGSGFSKSIKNSFTKHFKIFPLFFFIIYFSNQQWCSSACSSVRHAPPNTTLTLTLAAGTSQHCTPPTNGTTHTVRFRAIPDPFLCPTTVLFSVAQCYSAFINVPIVVFYTKLQH